MAASTTEAKGDITKTTELAAVNAPIVVDMGKKRGKQIKRMRRGEGKLMMEINELVDELKTSGSITASSQPVIIVVQKKRKARALPWV